MCFVCMQITSFGMDPKIQETIIYLEGSLRAFAHGRDGGPSLLGKPIKFNENNIVALQLFSIIWF